MTKSAPIRTFANGRHGAGAVIARARPDDNSLVPLVPIILLTLFMLAAVIRPI